MLILAAGETEIDGVDSQPLSSQPPKPGTLFDIMPMHYRTQKAYSAFSLSLNNSSTLCPVLHTQSVVILYTGSSHMLYYYYG